MAPSASTELETPALTPEARLLLATAGGPAMDPLIRDLAAGPFDWEQLLALAVRDRSIAVVAARLRRARVSLDPAVAQRFARHGLVSNLRMTALAYRLNQTLAGLAAARIPVVLLKGAALGQTVYDSLVQRPMLDLDLLVPQSDLGTARAVALTCGWEPSEFEVLAGFYATHPHLAPLVDRQGGNYSLELHNALFFRDHPFAWPVEELWQRSEAIAGTFPFRVPCTTDLLLHLALHFSWSHVATTGAWRSFRDLRVIMEQRPVDWDELVQLAWARRASTGCYWLFRLARRYAGIAVPAAVEQALRPPWPEWWLRVLDRHFALQWYPARVQCPSELVAHSLWRSAIRPRASGHGDTVPWQRSAAFPQPGQATHPLEGGLGKIQRHVRNAGGYLRYLLSILIGMRRSPLTRSPVE